MDKRLMLMLIELIDKKENLFFIFYNCFEWKAEDIGLDFS